jgi:hypothetical protein
MVLPSRRVVTRPARAQHREMLAHVGHLAADRLAEVAHRELADGERLEDAQAFGVGEGSSRPRRNARDRTRPRTAGCPTRCVYSISVCANTQVHRAASARDVSEEGRRRQDVPSRGGRWAVREHQHHERVDPEPRPSSDRSRVGRPWRVERHETRGPLRSRRLAIREQDGHRRATARHTARPPCARRVVAIPDGIPARRYNQPSRCVASQRWSTVTPEVEDGGVDRRRAHRRGSVRVDPFAGSRSLASGASRGTPPADHGRRHRAGLQ